MSINMVEGIVLGRRKEKWEKCSVWAHIYTSPGGAQWHLILLYVLIVGIFCGNSSFGIPNFLELIYSHKDDRRFSMCAVNSALRFNE